MASAEMCLLIDHPMMCSRRWRPMHCYAPFGGVLWRVSRTVAHSLNDRDLG